jgi:rod shape determining protein RodA
MTTTLQRPAPGAPGRRVRPPVWRHLDVVLVVTVVVLAVFGAVMVYSSTRVPLDTAGISPTYYLDKQLVFVGVGIVVMVAVAAVDYRHLRAWAPFLYVASLLMLVAVFAVGSRVKGAQAWFQFGPYQFEPSEFAKIALILALSAFAARFKGHLPGLALLAIVALAVVPFALIFKQPDLGTALVLSAVLIVVVMIAGARLGHLLLLAALAVGGVVGVVHLGVLHQYQVDRLSSFLSTPDRVSAKILAEKNNTQAANEYNVVESKNAISDGGITGTGLYKGTSTNLSQVPEQHTDFIFSAAGEQLGLIGCVVLLGLFLLVMWRTWQACLLSRDLFGTLVCAGVLAMLLFQVFENIGMTMGIMPVAGIPLPWMSYGGSAIVVEFIAIGLVLNVRMRRFT